MTQIGERISPALIADINHDEDCYFCRSKEPPKEEENVVDDDPDEDSDFPGLMARGIKFKNDASKLGRALGGSPRHKKVTIDGKRYSSSVAAHHLIPGNASLKKSKFFKHKKYIWTEGKAKGNIGYDVNSEPNGVWLPGNYAVRPWSGRPGSFQRDYAFESIEAWNAQFHDAHRAYSDEVRKALDAVYNKLAYNENIVCPEASKKKNERPEEKNPLYPLVARFHTISQRMKRKLVFPTRNWFRNIYTSRFSLEYMNRISPPKKR